MTAHLIQPQRRSGDIGRGFVTSDPERQREVPPGASQLPGGAQRGTHKQPDRVAAEKSGPLRKGGDSASAGEP